MSKLSQYLRNHYPEQKALADGLILLIGGIALDPAEREALLSIADRLSNGADNIKNSLFDTSVDEVTGVVTETPKEDTAAELTQADLSTLRASILDTLTDRLKGYATDDAVAKDFAARDEELQTALSQINTKLDEIAGSDALLAKVEALTAQVAALSAPKE